MTTLRERSIEIGAKIIRHGRCVTFQLAEVAVPKASFAEILRRIDGLAAKWPRRSGAPNRPIWVQ